MTPYERLMDEALPTGTFGHARPTGRRAAEPAPMWTPAEQAAHLATLNAALDGFELDDDYASNKRDRYREQRAHLRLVDGGSPASRSIHQPQEGTAA
ncbi:hypothetical protein TUSST3_08800 [Streptomyces sp. TUS-ST3]|uniref:hypothetical protein n=1 Tax=Streptomyces sp. TUS-ST3 TaxID=3025591 RepID=UPI0024E0C66F|nr:hypothetical protein [Streptomyces sp. TUS-ST3]GLP64260.1 hypothetical protein TUSST3_08800 [Streptomyces sp. TUS-ST3]